MRESTTKTTGPFIVAEARRCQLPELTGAAADDWVAQCGICTGKFAVRAKDARPDMTAKRYFCLDCRCRGTKPPGELHWRRRGSTIARKQSRRRS